MSWRVVAALLLPLAAAAGVEEVTSEAQFKKILSDNPAVVVDFYSQTCGPCIMMAPIFKEVAREYEGRLKLIKVDVQRSYVGVQIRSMPTFHFYLHGKLENQFSGGDERGLKQMSQALSAKAEAMDVEVSLGALEAFYQKHDPSKLDKVDEIYEKYPAYKLVAILKKKYGVAPEHTKKTPPKAHAAEGGAGGEKKAVDIRKMDLEELEAEVYRRKSQMEEKEVAMLDRKNERRLEKILGSPDGKQTGEGGEAGQGVSAAAPVKVAVLGGGPAGVTAAIYAARAGLKPLVIAPALGGQLMSKGVNVENYPGLDGESGGEIIRLMKRQALKFSTTFADDWVTSVDLSVRPFVINTNGSALTAHSLVLATGADSRWLGVAGEEDFKGGGISSCATCDGFLFTGKPVVVVGGGDTAMEEALVLARTSSHVTLLHRRGEFRASKAAQAAVLNHPKITIMYNTVVQEFVGGDPAAGGVLTTVVAQDVSDASNVTNITADAAFVAIGHIPNTGFVAGQLEMNDAGYLVTRAGSTACSVDGVFAAGDVADWTYRQAITSAGSGSQAALDAERWISENSIGGLEDEEAEECHPGDYESWTMKQIRKQLSEMGVDVKAECRGCMEKSQFIEVLCRHGGA